MKLEDLLKLLCNEEYIDVCKNKIHFIGKVEDVKEETKHLSNCEVKNIYIDYDSFLEESVLVIKLKKIERENND